MEVLESRDGMERLLQEEKVGYLGLSLDEKPYVVPLNYPYSEGRIWFHCGFRVGKLDFLKKNPQVCFTVVRQTGQVREHAGDPCHVDSDSVICYGRAKVVEDMGEREITLDSFNCSFRPDAADVPFERVKNCCVVEITIQKMTGRWERERKRTYRHYSF